MCGCGTAGYCEGNCRCGCDHGTLYGARQQARFAWMQVKEYERRAEMWRKRALGEENV